jgi:hypothetical protein
LGRAAGSLRIYAQKKLTPAEREKAAKLLVNPIVAARENVVQLRETLEKVLAKDVDFNSDLSS